MPYTATSLRHYVEFLALVKVPDGGGGSTNQWLSLSPPVKVPAMIKPRSSRERYMAGQTASAEASLIVVRYHPGLAQTMRVRYKTRVFEILGMVVVEERDTWIEIEAEEQFGE